jgi:hypothetical protein
MTYFGFVSNPNATTLQYKRFVDIFVCGHFCCFVKTALDKRKYEIPFQLLMEKLFFYEVRGFLANPSPLIPSGNHFERTTKDYQ